MKELRVVTMSGAEKILPQTQVERLTEILRGELLFPGNEGYEHARRLWNAMVDKRPALIARCAGVADVISCLRFAREHELLTAIRGGGHNVAGTAMSEGGLTIDLSPMRGVRVDARGRTARVEAGCTWAILDHETQAFGLATTGGTISSTGVAGLTLGGGMGWLARRFGLACDNLRSVDLVTEDGRLVTASADEEAELFWAVRGGGGNFGVATSFEFGLHPVDQVLGGMVLHPLAAAPEVLRFYRDFTRDAPDELCVIAALLTAPQGTPVAALAVCYSGSLAEGERVLAPLRRFGTPVADTIGPMPYVRLQRMLDAGFPEGRRNYWKSSFMDGIDDDAVELFVERFAAVPSPHSALIVEQYGGAASRIPDEAAAFGHRRMPYNLLVLSMWTDPAADAANIAWARDLWGAARPFASEGVYVNYLGAEADEGTERVRAAYGPAKLARLAALKRRYDPANLFRGNQNIRPAA
jgi:FAD/FMN-containing dehydrogenase